jgi:hypothetical protein
MARRLSAKVAGWVKENQGRHFCECGCGQAIAITAEHYYPNRRPVPSFLRGHHPRRTALEVERFWGRVHKGDRCWAWTGAREGKGYGRFQTDSGRFVKAHRYAWELANGPTPVGLYVCHHCDHPPCVRLDHLFLGTALDNARDRDAKGRLDDRRGARNGNAKLSEADVRQIRARAAAGETQTNLGQAFGVGQTTVSEILAGKKWKAVT